MRSLVLLGRADFWVLLVGSSSVSRLDNLHTSYDQGVIANILVMEDFNRRFPITPFQQGLLSSSAVCSG